MKSEVSYSEVGRKRVVDYGLESLEDTLQSSFNDTQTSLRSLLNNIVEKVVLDRLRNEVIGKMLDAHIVKMFYTHATAERLSKSLLSSSSFRASTATFVTRKRDAAMEDKKYTSTFASKELISNVETYTGDSESPDSPSDSGSDEVPVESRQIDARHVVTES